MVVGEVAEGLDVLVVGGGPGGYAAAAHAARLGREVTLVDVQGSQGLGGICLNVGCIPSKALIDIASLAATTRSAGKRGLLFGDVKVDLVAFQQWKNKVILRLRQEVEHLMSSNGVRVIGGRFRFTGCEHGVVELDGDRPSMHVTFKHCILATGSRPRELPGLPVDGAHVLTSTEVLDLDYIPETVAVIGGGYIGVELGSALQRLGSRLTIVEVAPTLLPTAPRRLVRPVEKALTAGGAIVLTKTKVTSIRDGEIDVVGPDGNVSIVQAQIVVATIGRVPNSEDMGLDSAHVVTDEDGYVNVARDLMATPNIAAIGDLVRGPALAHRATAHARIAAEAICGRVSAFEPMAIPEVIYSFPEIAWCGDLFDHPDAISVELPVRLSSRARISDSSDGLLQLSVWRDNGVIRGGGVTGTHASELIAEIVLALELACTAEDLALSIHPHPTVSELWREAAERAEMARN